MVAELHKYTIRIVYFKLVNCMVCEFYLNKASKRNKRKTKLLCNTNVEGERENIVVKTSKSLYFGR